MVARQEKLEGAAARIAREHRLPEERVLAVVSRCADVGWLATAIDYCELEHAIEALGAGDALSLFERRDLTTLTRRQRAWEYLCLSGVPVLSLGELAQLLQAFCSHLEDNRGPLLDTGLPELSFPGSSWLSDRLARLYFVKLPVGYRDRTLPDGSVHRTYIWGRARRPFRVVAEPAQGRHIDCSPEPECVDPSTVLYSPLPEDEVAPYEDAPLIDELDYTEAVFLEDARPLLLDLKLEALHRVTESLNAARVRGLWRDCRRLIIERLAETGQPASFFLQMDRVISGCRELRRWVPDPSVVIIAREEFLAGGVTALLGLVGHCEEELRVGAFRKTAEHLRQALSVGYWAALAVDRDGDLDRALDRFGALKGNLQRFWDDYLVRVSGMATGGRTAGTGPRAPVDTADKEPEPLAGRVTVELHVESGRIKVGGRELKGVTGNMFEILRVASEDDGVRLTVEMLELHRISNPRELAPRIQSVFAENGIPDHGPIIQVAKVPLGGRLQWIFCWNAKPDSRTQDRPIRLFTADLH